MVEESDGEKFSFDKLKVSKSFESNELTYKIKK